MAVQVRLAFSGCVTKVSAGRIRITGATAYEKRGGEIEGERARGERQRETEREIERQRETETETERQRQERQKRERGERELN